MENERLIQRLMTIFLGELEDHLRTLNRELLALEKEPTSSARGEHFKTLFRVAHSLKGAARSVSVGTIETACHQLEEIFAASQAGQLGMSADLFELLFATVDAIDDARQRLQTSGNLSGAPLSDLIPQLQAAAKESPNIQSPRAPRPASPHGFDIRSRPSAEIPVPPEKLDSRVQPLAEIPAPFDNNVVPEPIRMDGVVRVPVAKLDRLLARSGELLIARHRAEARSAEILQMQEFAKGWRADWPLAGKAVEKLLKRDGQASPPRTSVNRTKPVNHLPRRAALALERNGENLRKLSGELAHLAEAVSADHRLLVETATSLESEIRRMRMLPFAEACEGLQRMVRDLAMATNKEVDLKLEGGEIELDRSILEGIKDPLLHLVRNAVDHGIEPAHERLSSGKSARGTISVSAVLRGSRVEVAISDDGRGFDLDAVRRQAKKRTLPTPDNQQDLVRLAFEPGFSTAAIITEVSGRGIGLDAVRSSVEGMRGTVAVSFQEGQGTQFAISLPLTLTTIRALLVKAGGQTYALDSSASRGVRRVRLEDLHSIEGREVLLVDGAPALILSLADILGLATREPRPSAGHALAVVLSAGARQAAFMVDEILAEQEILAKSLGPRLLRVRNIAGATTLATGQLALILNIADLIESALGRAPAQRLSAALSGIQPKVKKRLIVADDSVTTRTMETSVLQAAGYEVMSAVDGLEAWQMLREHGADLVVSDVEMPRMDGFELTKAIRQSRRFPGLPIILLTGRESEDDKAQGMAAGADAYLVKSTFDQRSLVEAIEQLL